MLYQSVKPNSLALHVLSLFFLNILCLKCQPFVTNPSLPEQWALLAEPRYKQLCEILCKSFFMFSFIYQSRTRPLSKPSMVATWEKVHGDLLFFFLFFFHRTSSSEQKESLLKSLASFLPRPRSNTVCEMRVAWV